MASVRAVPGAHSEPIAVGVLLDARVQEGWVVEALRQVLAVPGAILCAVVVMRRAPVHGIASRLHGVVAGLDGQLRCRGEPMFARMDVAEALGGPEPFEIEAIRSQTHWRLDGHGAAVLRAIGADVWLSFCALPPQSPFPAVSALGVWGLEIGSQVPAASPWAGAAEIGANSDVTTVQLVDYSRPERAVLHRACGATVRNSVRRNRLLALRKGLAFYGRQLQAMRRQDGRIPAIAAAEPPAMEREPTIGAVLRLSWRLVNQVLANRWRAAAMRSQWRIGYYYADEDTDATTRAREMYTLVPPKDHDWADPFIVRHGGRRFIFFEDLPHRVGRAHICAVELFAGGRVGAPQVVLQRPYHLSYPFVFEWEGGLFMIPETAERGSVELYRCEEFPHRWSLYKVLLDGVRAFDSTLVRNGGLWWLFTNIAEPGAAPSEDLSIFWSHALTGPWTPHPANPVVCDVRRARGAGPIFRRDGGLFRPSQDCGADYGSAVWINRIELLDRTSYRETPVARIDPDSRAGMRCLHTFGTEGRLRVVDFVVREPRWSGAWA